MKACVLLRAPSQKEPSTDWEKRVDGLYDEFFFGKTIGEQRTAFLEMQRIWVQNQPVVYLATKRSALVVRKGYQVTGHATTGRAADPALIRPIIESLRVKSPSR